MNAVTALAGGLLRPLAMTGVRRQETAAGADAEADTDFDALYRAQSRRVLQTCRYLLGSPDEAEDAAQEVFLRARQRFEQYDRERPFAGWILGVASHHCVDRLRRRGREMRLFGAEDVERAPAPAREPGPLTALLARERGRQVREAVAALPVKYSAGAGLFPRARLRGDRCDPRHRRRAGVSRPKTVAADADRAGQEEPMTCPDEPTLMMLADDELAVPAAVREHAGRCASCRAALAELRAERGLLVQALHEGALDDPVVVPTETETTVAPAASGGRWRELASPAGAVAVVVVAAAWAMGVPPALEVPSFLEWGSPFHPYGRLTWLFTGLTLGVGVALDAASITAMVTAIGQAAGVLLLLLIAASTVARHKWRWAVPASLAGMLAAPAVPAEAFEVRGSAGDVVIAADETIDDTLVVRGERVTIDGIVTGDVIAGGTSVRIRGTVQGNVVAWAQTLDLEGEVGGSVFASGQFVTVPGELDGALYVFSQDTRIFEGGRVGGGVASWSYALTVQGRTRGVRALGYRVDVTGDVERSVHATARRIAVGPRSRIGGTLTARVEGPDDLQINPAAALAAEPVVHLADDPASPSRYLTASFYLGQAFWLAAAFLAGWLLLWLAPGVADVRFETPAAALRPLGVGFLFVIATPVAAIIAGLTLVGLPLALVALALWALAIYLAKIPVALFLARTALGPRGAGGQASALLVGLLAVFVAVNLPFIGWIVNLALTLIGVGSLFAWALSAYRGSRDELARS